MFTQNILSNILNGILLLLTKLWKGEGAILFCSRRQKISTRKIREIFTHRKYGLCLRLLDTLNRWRWNMHTIAHLLLKLSHLASHGILWMHLLRRCLNARSEALLYRKWTSSYWQFTLRWLQITPPKESLNTYYSRQNMSGKTFVSNCL